MRNAVLIGLLVVALIAGLFAIQHFHSNKQEAPHPALTPTEAARRIGPGFVGTQRIGAWVLECKKPHHPPAWALASIKRPGHDLPELKKSPHCRLGTSLHYPNDSAQWQKIFDSRVGKTRNFNIEIRIASRYWSPGDYFELHIDETVFRVKVILCAKELCVALPTRKPDELLKMRPTAGEQLESAKSAALVFPASAGQKAVTVNIPLDGFQLGAAAMRRDDVLNHP